MPNSCYTLITPTSVWFNHLLANSKYPRRPFLHLHGLIKETATHLSTWKLHILFPDRRLLDIAVPRRVICHTAEAFREGKGYEIGGYLRGLTKTRFVLHDC